MANIISLTSFGKRMYECTARAVFSLVDQSVPADRIILWAQGNYPSILEKIPGLEIRRVSEALGSHNKWFWATQEFPNDNIILADDDCYYPFNWLETMLNFHQSDPTKVVLNRFCYIPNKYNLLNRLYWYSLEQSSEIPDSNTCRYVPLNGCGTLLPPNSLHKDAFNKDLLLEIASNNDDIWIWIMTLLKNDNPFLLVPKNIQQLSRIAVQDPTRQNKCGGTALFTDNILNNQSQSVVNELMKRYPRILELLAFDN